MLSRLSSEVMIHFLTGWMDWTDIVRLDSGSSCGMHMVITMFMQSHTFWEAYSESFGVLLECDEKPTASQYLRLVRRLEWISYRRINVNYCSVSIFLQHLAPLDELKQSTQYPFVKKLIIHYDDISSYSQLISVVIERFPLIDDIKLVEESCPKEILRALLVICRYCPIHSVFLGTNGMFEFDTRHLVSKIIAAVGERLQSFQVPLQWVIPHEIVQSVADHCPKIEHMFSNCHLDGAFIIESYMDMCRKMGKLQELNIGTNGFYMTDDHFCNIVSSLPLLKVVKIVNNLVTIRSMRHTFKHCPDIQKIALAHISWSKKTNVKSSGQSESSMSFHGISTEEIQLPDFYQFVQEIPLLSELSFLSHLR